MKNLKHIKRFNDMENDEFIRDSKKLFVALYKLLKDINPEFVTNYKINKQVLQFMNDERELQFTITLEEYKEKVYEMKFHIGEPEKDNLDIILQMADFLMQIDGIEQLYDLDDIFIFLVEKDRIDDIVEHINRNEFNRIEGEIDNL